MHNLSVEIIDCSHVFRLLRGNFIRLYRKYKNYFAFGVQPDDSNFEVIETCSYNLQLLH
jgi:predicted metal-dependent hydrolase